MTGKEDIKFREYIYKNMETFGLNSKKVQKRQKKMDRCKHFLKPYFGVFSAKKPTEKQIKEDKLYQCSKCHKWFSFLGKVEE